MNERLMSEKLNLAFRLLFASAFTLLMILSRNRKGAATSRIIKIPRIIAVHFIAFFIFLFGCYLIFIDVNEIIFCFKIFLIVTILHFYFSGNDQRAREQPLLLPQVLPEVQHMDRVCLRVIHRQILPYY